MHYSTLLITINFFLSSALLGDQNFGGTWIGIRNCNVGSWFEFSVQFRIETRYIVAQSKPFHDDETSKEAKAGKISVVPLIYGVEAVLGEPVNKFGILTNEFVLALVYNEKSKRYLRVFSRMSTGIDRSWKYSNFPDGLPVVELAENRVNLDLEIDQISAEEFELEKLYPILKAYNLLPVKKANSRQILTHFLVLNSDNSPMKGIREPEEIFTSLNHFSGVN